MRQLGRKGKESDARTARVLINSASTPASVTDHGSLLGLGDDDHAQYASADGMGTRAAYSAVRVSVRDTSIVSDGSGVGVALATNSGLSISSGLALGTPTTLTVSSTNSVTTSTHSHAITSASNPGAVASLLATDASGYLTLVRFGLGRMPTFLADFVESNLVGSTVLAVTNSAAADVGNIVSLRLMANDDAAIRNVFTLDVNLSTIATGTRTSTLTFLDQQSGTNLAWMTVIGPNVSWTGTLKTTNTTNSTSTLTGSFQTLGGAGFAGAVFVGETLSAVTGLFQARLANLDVQVNRSNATSTNALATINNTYSPASDPGTVFPASLVSQQTYNSTISPAGGILIGQFNMVTISNSGVWSTRVMDYNFSNSGGGAVPNVNVIHVRNPTNSGGGSITNFRAIFVESLTGGGGTNYVFLANGIGLFKVGDTTNASGIGTAAGVFAGGVSIAMKLYVGSDVVISAATANLYMKDTATGWQVASTTVITPQANNTIRATAYTSGLVGWNISATGNAEFNNVDVRGAIHASIFTYNAILTTAGTLGVFNSAAKLLANVTIPNGPTYGTTTVSIDTADAEGITHAASQLFAVNDIIRLKDGLVGDTWLKVSAASDQTTFWRYTAIIMAGSANVTYRSGMGIPDYGISGQGFIIQTADQTNAPYLQMATHAATMSSQDVNGSLVVTPQLRLGNLNGSYGYATETYGLGMGQYGAASKVSITIEQTNGIRIINNTTQLAQWDTSGNILVGQESASQSNVYITAGGVQFRTNTTVNMILDTAGKITVGQAANSLSRIELSAGVINFISRSAGAVDTTQMSMSTAGVITVGAVGASLSNIQITAGAVNFRTNTTVNMVLDTAGKITVGQAANSLSRIELSAGVINFISRSAGAVDTTQMSMSTAGIITVGAVGASLSNVLISAGAVRIRNNTTDIIVFDTTEARIDNVLKMSGASAAISIGATPPTSASAGTGIWIDRTGLYGLNANVQQAYINSTGQIKAGAGNVTIDANGISIEVGGGITNQIKWYLIGSLTATLNVGSSGSTDQMYTSVGGSVSGNDGQIVLNVDKAAGGSGSALTIDAATATVTVSKGLNVGAATGASAGAVMLKEITAPGAPGTDMGVLYMDVSGVKSRLMIRFQSGAAQQIAIEP